jgi:flavin reductase (DIM6/NTAB) family NADH-FMN oxidoreductase RutF
MKIQVDPKKTNFPMPAVLISCQHEEKLDIIAISWITMISQNPCSLLVSFLKTRFSLSIIQKTMRFAVNVPQVENWEKLNFCGIYSGRDHEKFKEMSFTPFYSKLDPQTPMIKECPINILCEAVNLIDYEDRILVLGKVSEVFLDEEITKDKKNVCIEKMKPFIYWMSGGEYWNIGSKAGSVKKDYYE